MAVVVMGMGMPVRCRDCILRCSVYVRDLMVYEDICAPTKKKLGKRDLNDRKPSGKYCPLVEVEMEGVE